MIEELATVVALNGVDKFGNNKVTVESQIKSSCSGCQQIDNCGSGQIAKAIPQRKLSVNVVTKISVKLGDVLVLGLKESSLLKTAGQVYLWPLIGLVLSSGLGQWLLQQGIFSSELIAVALGAAGGYLGYRVAKFWQVYSKQAQSLVPKVLRIEQSVNKYQPTNINKDSPSALN